MASSMNEIINLDVGGVRSVRYLCLSQSINIFTAIKINPNSTTLPKLQDLPEWGRICMEDF